MTSDARSRPSTTQLKTLVRDQVSLTPGERRQMHQLMADHFENVDWSDFDCDLAEKEWVIVTSHPERGILGFTTLTRLTTEIGGERLNALFSGDTVLDPDIWGAGGWARIWGRHAATLMKELAPAPLYWLLLTATHRTYGFLPTFLKEFYPRPDVATPKAFQGRIEALVRLKFPEEYEAERGVVQLKKRMPVQSERIPIATNELADKHAQFFAARNPGYLQGDFLVCIGDLSYGNRTRLGHRFFALPEE